MNLVSSSKSSFYIGDMGSADPKRFGDVGLSHDSKLGHGPRDLFICDLAVEVPFRPSEVVKAAGDAVKPVVALVSGVEVRRVAAGGIVVVAAGRTVVQDLYPFRNRPVDQGESEPVPGDRLPVPVDLRIPSWVQGFFPLPRPASVGARTDLNAGPKFSGMFHRNNYNRNHETSLMETV